MAPHCADDVTAEGGCQQSEYGRVKHEKVFDHKKEARAAAPDKCKELASKQQNEFRTENFYSGKGY
jgi:hypothetical protein